MDIMEIILLIAGGTVFILSFFIPDRKPDRADTGGMAGDGAAELVSGYMESVKNQVEELAEGTERSLEKLSNEKIMAVSEYSDTVLGQIHKNHEETVFLYDMLNSKHASLKGTVAEVERSLKEAQETIAALERVTQEASAVREDLVPGPYVVQRENREKEPAVPAEPGNLQEDPTVQENSFSDSGENGQDGSGNEKVLELYKQGMSPMAIARKLGRGVGEVTLVIDLFRG